MADTTDVDAIRYRREAAWGTLIPLLVFGSGAALQSEIFQVAAGLAAYGEIYDVPLWARLVANLTAAAVIGLAVWLIPINPRRRVTWLTAAVGAVTVAVLVRGALQLTLGVYPSSLIGFALLDVGVGHLAGVLSLAVGVVLAEAFKRARSEERSALRQALRATAALEALQAEELRVRRDVAEGLHGTVQHQLVLVGARLRAVMAGLPVGATVTRQDSDELAEIEKKIDDIREYDVRQMSQLLYPEGTGLGLVPAVRMMLRRIPSSIEINAHIDDAVVEYDDPASGRVPPAVRLLAVRLLEEAVSNALRHGNASRIDVSLRLADDGALTVTVNDDGSGMAEQEVLSGLERLRERLVNTGGSLEIRTSALGGVELQAAIPLVPLRALQQQE